MAKLAALIFDVDGTLADTERDGHRVSFNAAFAEAGLDWEWSVPLYGELLAVTGGKERIRHYLDHYNTAFKRPTGLDGLIAGLHASKTRHYTEMLATGGVPLRPGVRRLLEEARAEGVRLAIATTTTPANVMALLEHANPEIPASWFETIAAGDVVAAKKPAPDIFDYALEQMGLDPSRCIALEDSENGLKAARGAGLRTVITTNDYTRDQDFTGAELVLNHLGEPDRPFSVLKGTVNGKSYLDLDTLRQLAGTSKNASFVFMRR